MKKLNLLVLFCVSAFMSCTKMVESEFSVDKTEVTEVNKIVAIFEEPLDDDGVTRATFDNENSTFLWAASDTIGIFPDTGDQVSFPVSGQAGKPTISFNGGGWGLKATSTYYAYYPFDRKSFWGYNAKNEMKVSFTGQTQDGKNQTDFAKRTPFVSYGVNNNGNIHFTFWNIASYGVFTVSLPDPGTYVKAVLTTDDGEDYFMQEGTYNLTETTDNDVPTITGLSYGSSISVDLENITTTSANESFIIYMIIPPTEALADNVRLTIINDEGYSYTINPDRPIGQFNPKTRYRRSFVLEKNIAFADPNIKALCVANWDTDSDGELSYDEAEAVTSLGTVFKNNTEITSFGELQYFTGLSSLADEAFYGCTNLARISIPSNVLSIGSHAFYATGLTSVTISGATTIGNEAFAYCGLLESAELTGAISLGYGVFGECPNLVSVNLPEATNLGDWTFSNCRLLEDINVPKVVTVGHDCFYNTYALDHLSLPEATTFIFEGTNWAMFFNSGITQLDAPKLSSDIVNSLGGNFTSLYLPSVKKIISSGSGAFRGNKGLVTVNLPNVEEIGYEAFMGCTALETVYAPKLKIIGRSCFDGCVSLSTIVAPNATTLDWRAFAECTSLESVYMPKVTEIGCAVFMESGIEEIDLPLVTYVSANAFHACHQLKTINLPILNSIGEEAFAANESMETFYFGTGPNGLHGDFYDDLEHIYIRYADNNYNNIFAESDLSNCTLYLPERFRDRIINNLNKAAFKEVIYLE